MKTIAGITDKNRALLDEMHRAFQGSFSALEASARLKISKDRASFLLMYFARKGWLSRIRRGLYIVVPLGTVNPSEYKKHPWLVATRVFYPCYIGGWSAAAHWELTDQIFNSIVVFTSKKFRNKKIMIQNTEYILKFLDNRHFGTTKAIWLENTKFQVSDVLQTIIDILDIPSLGGGMRSVADIVKTYFESDWRNDDAITAYIDKKRNRTIYKRLGYLLDVIGINAPRLRDKCHERISKGYSLLDPAVETKGVFSRKWNLRINVEIKS
jgi:predicted transcriptional regulator of viral defense system